MDYDRVILILIVLGLSIFGAHARYVFDYGSLKIRALLGAYVVGSFSGLAMFYLINTVDSLTKDIKFFCVVMAGFCARDILTLISGAFIDKLKKYLGGGDKK